MNCTSGISKCMIPNLRKQYCQQSRLNTVKQCFMNLQNDGRTTSCWLGRCGSFLFTWYAVLQIPVSYLSVVSLKFLKLVVFMLVWLLSQICCTCNKIPTWEVGSLAVDFRLWCLCSNWQDRFYIKRVSALPLKAVGKLGAFTWFRGLLHWIQMSQESNALSKLSSIRCSASEFSWILSSGAWLL